MGNDKKLSDRTDQETWSVAQDWELQHWLRQQKALSIYGKNYAWKLLSLFGIVEKYRGDDRNHWWKQSFNDYTFLPQTMENALEVGCGPYTNLRLIQKACKPKHVFLSDPLIRTYVKFKMTFVSEMYREAVCTLDDHSLEELPFADNYFDLAVMINVLDHVRDANLCMQNLMRVLKPGGFVIIGQDLTNEEDLMRQPEGLHVGHPITLDEKWFEPHLRGRFDEILYKILPREAGWVEQWHYGTFLFAGMKR